MGICPQKDVIYEKLSVKEHLELYARMKGIPPDEIAQRVCIVILFSSYSVADLMLPVKYWPY